MFGKFKKIVDSVSKSNSEPTPQKEDNETAKNSSENWLTSGIGFIKNSISETNPPSTKIPEKTTEEEQKSSQGTFKNMYQRSKNTVLSGVADMDAKNTAEIISAASSFLPFMKVLDVTDSLKLTNRSAFTEKMILNLQKMAKNELEKGNYQKSEQINLLLAQSIEENPSYSQELELLIELALIDGILTDQEKQLLFQKAEAEGIDLEAFKADLEKRLNAE